MARDRSGHSLVLPRLPFEEVASWRELGTRGGRMKRDTRPGMRAKVACLVLAALFLGASAKKDQKYKTHDKVSGLALPPPLRKNAEPDPSAGKRSWGFASAHGSTAAVDAPVAVFPEWQRLSYDEQVRYVALDSDLTYLAFHVFVVPAGSSLREQGWALQQP